MRTACRSGFGHIVRSAQEVCDLLAGQGPQLSVDMDELLQREALDVSAPTRYRALLRALGDYCATSACMHL